MLPVCIVFEYVGVCCDGVGKINWALGTVDEVVVMLGFGGINGRMFGLFIEDKEGWDGGMYWPVCLYCWVVLDTL